MYANWTMLPCSLFSKWCRSLAGGTGLIALQLSLTPQIDWNWHNSNRIHITRTASCLKWSHLRILLEKERKKKRATLAFSVSISQVLRHVSHKEIVKVNHDSISDSHHLAMLNVVSSVCELRARFQCDIVYIVEPLSHNFYFLFVIWAILRSFNLYFN